MPEHLGLFQAKQVQLYYPNQPYLAFIPVEDVFEGPVFGRFQGTQPFFATKVEGTIGRFIFDQALAQSWLRVEYALRTIIWTVYPRLVPLDTPQPPFPSSSKFHLSRTSPEAVVKSVVFAQKLFIFLIAQLRHALAVSRKIGKGDWVKALEGFEATKHFDKTWISDLAASRALQTARLAGTVIRHTDRIAPYDAHLMSHSCAPVFIEYAKISVGHGGAIYVETLIDDAASRRFYLPFPVQHGLERIEKLWREEQSFDVPSPCVPGSQTDVGHESLPVQHVDEGAATTASIGFHDENNDLDSPESPRNAKEECLPLPLPHSEQQPGEWWHVHHLEGTRRRSLEMYTESDDEETDRLELEKAAEAVNANSTLPPDFTAGKVFVWEPTQLHPTFLLRRLLTAKETMLIWPTFLPSHRVYNYLDDCWDLYDMSCDLKTYKRVMLEELETTATDGVVDQDSPPENVQNKCDLELDRQEVMQGRYAEVQLRKQPLFFNENAQGYVAHRFGFRFPDPLMVFHPKENVQWWYYVGQRHQPEPDIQKQLSSTIYCLKGGHEGHLHSLLDIFSDASSIIQRNHVQIRRFPTASFRTSTTQTSRNIYLVFFSSENKQDWFVGVEQAADLVLALRENWLDSRDQLVASYLTHGIQFFTLRLVPEEEIMRPADPEATIRIPSEPQGGNYNLTHFFNYEKQREQILDSELGRVIGRSGGYAARLWRRDFTKFKQRMRQVNAGPTDSALWTGVRVSCGGKEYYDDVLTTHLESVICGEYISEAGKYLNYNSKNDIHNDRI